MNKFTHYDGEFFKKWLRDQDFEDMFRNEYIFGMSKIPENRKLEIGDTCPKCGHTWKHRELFTGSFVGCLC